MPTRVCPSERRLCVVVPSASEPFQSFCLVLLPLASVARRVAIAVAHLPKPAPAFPALTLITWRNCIISQPSAHSMTYVRNPRHLHCPHRQLCPENCDSLWQWHPRIIFQSWIVPATEHTFLNQVRIQDDSMCRTPA